MNSSEGKMLSKYEVLILAGGEGRRLKQVWKGKPKILAPVKGKPYFDWFVGALYEYGFRRFTFLLGAYSEQVIEYAQSHRLSHHFSYSVESEPLGTGGAIAQAVDRDAGEPVFVMNGDSFCVVDLEAMLKAHLDRSADVTMALARVPDGRDYGSVECDEDMRVISFEEKKAREGPALVNAGVYLISPAVMRAARAGPFSIERELFPQLIRSGDSVFGFEASSEILDIGTPERLELAQEKLVSMMPR